MAKIYIQGSNGKYHKIGVGRMTSVPIIIDWGGCTGEKITLDMNELFENGAPSYGWDDTSYPGISHERCRTQDIDGIIIDGEKLEVEKYA